MTAWVRLTQHLIPKNLSSAVVYRATRSRRPWLARQLVRWFARAYGVDLSEAATADLDSYATFNEFFTRELKRGARPIAGGADTLVAPADGVLTEHGAVDGGRLYQAKGSAYTLAELLGVSEGTVLVQHALKNALIPVVTVLGLQMGTLLGGAVITETVFAWPGMGMVTVTAIHQRDYPVVQSAVLVSAVLVVLINWFVDVLYHYLDPRIR